MDMKIVVSCHHYCGMAPLQKSRHAHCTRNLDCVSVPLHRTATLRKGLFHAGPIYRNRLDKALKKSQTIKKSNFQKQAQLTVTYKVCLMPSVSKGFFWQNKHYPYRALNTYLICQTSVIT